MAKPFVNTSKIVLDEPTQRYLSTKKKSTAGTYRTTLKRFQFFYEKPLGEFITEVEKVREENKKLPVVERKKYGEDVVRDYIEWLRKKGYANNPIRNGITSIQNMMKYYNVPISFAFIEVPEPISKKENHKYEWTTKDLKEFVDIAPYYRDKAIIVMMFQSGMGASEITELNYGDVRNGLKSEELPLLIDFVRVKNQNPFKTLIGADTVTYLKLYLETRGELKNNDPLFTKQGSKNRVTVTAIQNRLREIANRMDFIEVKKGEMSPARPHSLRAAFRSRLTGKTDTDLIKFWMGDKLGAKAGAYLNLSSEDHKKLYMAVEQYLSIETISEDVMAGRIGELKDIDEEYREELKELKSVQRNLIKSLDERNDEIQQIRSEAEQLKIEHNDEIEQVRGEAKQLVKKLRGDVAYKMGEMKSMIEQLGRELNIETWDQVQPIPKEIEPNEDAEREEAKRVAKEK